MAGSEAEVSRKRPATATPNRLPLPRQLRRLEGAGCPYTCYDFDQNCQELARKHGVTLINGTAFARMLLEAGFNGLDL